MTARKPSAAPVPEAGPCPRLDCMVYRCTDPEHRRSRLDLLKDRAVALGRPLTAAEGYELLRDMPQRPSPPVAPGAGRGEGDEEDERDEATPAGREAAAVRDKLPAMLTITQHAAAAHRASSNSAAAWTSLPEADKRAIEGRLIYDFDYLAGGVGRAAGTIYAAGPTDPPPTEPAP